MAIVRAYSYNITTNDIEPGAVTEPKIDLSSVNSTNLVLDTTGVDTNKPPTLTLERKSTTVADDMEIAKLSCLAKNHTGEDIEYFQGLVKVTDITDADEAGELTLSTYIGGRSGVAALKECVAIGAEETTGNVRGYALIINRPGDADLDFAYNGDTVDNLFRTRASSDQVGVGTAPNPTIGAVFQVTSTTAASVPAPRVTTTQRDAMSNIGNGCMVYNTTVNKLQCHNGSGWQDCF